MKEERFFYDPEVSGELSKEEAHHALKVLRLGDGDEIRLMDGKGTFYRATITAATGHRLLYQIDEAEPQQPAWKGHLHLAMAPTKLMDRVEWFAEKATEIGFDELSFLDCQFSERRVVKEERIDKILISAMKQSHKAWKPKLNCSTKSSDSRKGESLSGMQRFRDFINQDREGDKFICHCYEESDIGDGEKPLLFDVLREGVPTTVLIGPEGDFSVEEVKYALQNGYKSVTLGRSRLRTETAALVAVHMMQLRNADTP
ncbi:MAG: 16S rRNA (uracil(1498)-N(3))-methyltransferase [Bacteroidaceae bacterium]|nr:16S rRNA (uracil(1498)-N(3))-methyltransferase [Bacteroidaceae bacterium]